MDTPTLQSTLGSPRGIHFPCTEKRQTLKAQVDLTDSPCPKTEERISFIRQVLPNNADSSRFSINEESMMVLDGEEGLDHHSPKIITQNLGASNGHQLSHDSSNLDLDLLFSPEPYRNTPSRNGFMNDYSKKLLNCQTINRVVNIVQSLNRQLLSASHVTHLIALLLDGAKDSQKLAEKINALLFSPQRSEVAT